MKDILVHYGAYNALLAGISAFAYAVSFVVLRDASFSAIFLMLSGALTVSVMVSLWQHVSQVDKTYAMVTVVLGIIGGAGALVHGGYDLANVINPPTGLNPSLPSQVDPRGLLTFGVTGIAVLKISWLIGKLKQFPQNLSLLGMLSGVLLVVIYLGRLIVLDPANPILRYPILIEGFVVNPLWYLWLGMVILKVK